MRKIILAALLTLSAVAHAQQPREPEASCIRVAETAANMAELRDRGQTLEQIRQFIGTNPRLAAELHWVFVHMFARPEEVKGLRFNACMRTLML